MDDYPKLIEPFLDYILMDLHIIVAMPSYLAIGLIQRRTSHLELEENSYFKIYTSFYELFFLAIENMKKYISEPNQNPIEGTLIEWLTNSISWKGQFQHELKVIDIFLDNSTKNSTIIKFNPFDLIKLCEAFQQLLFKPFCLKPIINIAFQEIVTHLVSIEGGELLISKLNYQKSVPVVKEIKIFEADEDLFIYFCELLMRYKSELLISYLLKIELNLPNLILKRLSKGKCLKNSKKKIKL